MEEHVLAVLAERRRHGVRDGDSKYWLTLRRQISARALSEEKAPKWLAWLRTTQPLHPWVQRGHCVLCNGRLAESNWRTNSELGDDEQACDPCLDAEWRAEQEAYEEAKEAERLWYHDLGGEAWDDLAPEGLGGEFFDSDEPDDGRDEFDQ